MRFNELTEAVDNFSLYRQVNQAMLDLIDPIRAAKLSQSGSMVRRLSKALEPVVLSHIDLPEGFTFEIKIIVERTPKSSASGRMQVAWDDLLSTRHFTLFVFTNEHLIQNVFANHDPQWTGSMIRSFTSTLSHELVHMQQQTRMIKSLLARGYDYNRHLDISDKTRARTYNDRPIEAQAFAVEHATDLFFKVANSVKDVQDIVPELQRVKSLIPRAWRDRADRYKTVPDYDDPYEVFEGNPYLDRTARHGQHVSEETRAYYIKTFVKALNRIIKEQADNTQHPAI